MPRTVANRPAVFSFTTPSAQPNEDVHSTPKLSGQIGRPQQAAKPPNASEPAIKAAEDLRRQQKPRERKRKHQTDSVPEQLNASRKLRVIDEPEMAIAEPSLRAGLSNKPANQLAAVSKNAEEGETKGISTEVAANAQPGETAGLVAVLKGWCHPSRGHMTYSNFKSCVYHVLHWQEPSACLLRVSHANEAAGQKPPIGQ